MPTYNVLPMFYDSNGRVRKPRSTPTFVEFVKSSLFRRILMILVFLGVFWKLFSIILSTSSFESQIAVAHTAFTENKRIAIVTLFAKDQDTQKLKPLTFPNFKQYAALHGYVAIDALEIPAISVMYEEFQKTHARMSAFKFHVLQTLLPSFDWIMWSDSDSLFLNMSVPISAFLDPNYDAVFTVSPENDPVWALVNNPSHCILRNSEWSRSFLKDAIQMSNTPCKEYLSMTPDKKPPIVNSWIKLCSEDGNFWGDDQGIIQWLMMYKPRSYTCHMQLRGVRDFNSEFPWYGDGDFVVSFPKKPSIHRAQLISLTISKTNFTTGIVNRTGLNGELDPVSSPSNAPDMYDKHYAHLNTPCQSSEKEPPSLDPLARIFG